MMFRIRSEVEMPSVLSVATNIPHMETYIIPINSSDKRNNETK